MSPSDDPSPRRAAVEDGLAMFNEREYERSAATLHPDVEWDTSRLLPDGRLYRGRDELLAYWRDIGERWDELRIEPDEWIETDDALVMFGRLVGRGSGSGAPVEGPWHQVWRFEGDVAIRCENFGDRRAALAAAGASSDS